MKTVMLILVLLGGCASAPTYQPDDGHTPAKMLVTWHRVSFADVAKHCGDSWGKGPFGCAVFNRSGGTCDIYTVKEFTLELLGHETLHCFYGKWH